MIFGIGIDIVKTVRIEKAYAQHGQRLADKVLSVNESAAFKNSKQPVAFLAKHFAAKEALVKAMGTGFRLGIHMWQITINKSLHGQPQIECTAKAKSFLEEKNIHSIHLSITDEEDYTAAMVVLEQERHPG